MNKYLIDGLEVYSKFQKSILKARTKNIIYKIVDLVVLVAMCYLIWKVFQALTIATAMTINQPL